MHHTENGGRMSSASTELGKKSSEKKLLRKLPQTEYGVCMTSVKTEVGETTDM